MGPNENKPYFRKHFEGGLFQDFEVPTFNPWALPSEVTAAPRTFVSSKSRIKYHKVNSFTECYVYQQNQDTFLWKIKAFDYLKVKFLDYR